MRAMVHENVQFVSRTLRQAGVSPTELDDEIQRTFMVAARRLEDVRVGAERSFLFQVARNTASHARRTHARRREFPSDDLPEQLEPLGTPEDLAVRKQIRLLLDAALASMDETLRAVFVLYELEDLNTLEIAKTLGIARGTVASRLRRARAQIRQNVAAIELAWDLGVAAEPEAAGPAPLRRESESAVARALLGAGASMPGAGAMRARALAACLGLAG
jgi:RNA polymerase sigma-70 factor (ECF subfamily)